MAGSGAYSTLLKNSTLDNLATQLLDGVIEGYSGTPVAVTVADPGVAACVIFTQDGLPWVQGQADNGVNLGTAAAGAITDDGENYSGLGLIQTTMTWWRYYSNDKTMWIQGTASTSGSSMTVTTTAITVDGPVAITSMTFRYL